MTKIELYCYETLVRELPKITKALENLKQPTIITPRSYVLEDKQKLEWFNLFADYLQEIDSNKYEQACEYADKKQIL